MTEDLVEHLCDVHGTLVLSSYHGGEKNGRCVQLTTQEQYVEKIFDDAKLITQDKYVQMTFDDARKFFRDAIQAIDEIEKKYNENPPWWEQLKSP